MAERDENGRLTREGMEAVIKGGGSVMIDGEVVTDITKLPSAVDLAHGNEKATETLGRQLDEQMAALALQRARLDANVKLAKAKVEAEVVKQTERHAQVLHVPSPPPLEFDADRSHVKHDDEPEKRPVGRPRKDA